MPLPILSVYPSQCSILISDHRKNISHVFSKIELLAKMWFVVKVVILCVCVCARTCAHTHVREREREGDQNVDLLTVHLMQLLTQKYLIESCYLESFRLYNNPLTSAVCCSQCVLPNLHHKIDMGTICFFISAYLFICCVL